MNLERYDWKNLEWTNGYECTWTKELEYEIVLVWTIGDFLA